MGSLIRSRFAVVCLAVLVAVVGVCSPRVRAFAAARLSGIHSPHASALTQSGPIPFILDLSKHKPHKTTTAKAPAKHSKAAKPTTKTSTDKPQPVPPPPPAPAK